jgi:stage II sporulation protein D
MARKEKLFFQFIFPIFFLAWVPACLATPAQIYNNAGFNRSIKAYRDLARNNDVTGYLNLAVIYKDLGHYEQGIKILNFSRIKSGNDFRVLGLLGRMYYLNGQFDQAISVLSLLSRVKPNDREALITIGLCYQEKGNDLDAQASFMKALELDKDNVIARLSLADLYYRQNKFEESAREYKALSFIDASIESIYEYWGDILFRMNKLKDALKVYEKITFMEPQNKPAQERLSGIRRQLGMEYFEKQKAQRQASKGRKLVFVLPAEKAKGSYNVKIGLLRTDGSAEFKCSTNFTVKTRANGFLVGQGLAGESYTILRSGSSKLLISSDKKENMVIDEPVVIKPSKPEGTITLFDVKFGTNNFWSNVEDRSYRGEMDISIDKGIIKVINRLSLEEYLYGVVPAEMPTNWPQEALKAQAVAARSESIAKLARHRNEGFDLCAEVHCQVYSGVEKETQLGNMAVDATRGVILEYGSKAVDAVYSSNCGGHTQGNIFGDKEDGAYFTGVTDGPGNLKLTFPLSPYEMENWLKDPPAGLYCNIAEYANASSFRWVRIYSAEQLRRLVDAVSGVGSIRKMIVLKRNDSGHVEKIKIVGSESSCMIDHELNIRRALGNLRSSMFKVEARLGPDGSPKEFIFYGGGWGHGVGMCQSGSCGMAKDGISYQEILQHYFPRAHLKKAY